MPSYIPAREAVNGADVPTRTQPHGKGIEGLVRSTRAGSPGAPHLASPNTRMWVANAANQPLESTA